MPSQRGLTLRTKLLLSFAGVGLLVAVLSLAGNYIIRDASTRLENTLTAQVRPLARLNRLQAKIARIRVLEIELPRLTDLFAVLDQIELLRAERGGFERELSAFVQDFADNKPPEVTSLEEHWRRYETDLQRASEHAGKMELAAIQRLSTFESAGRFRAISRLLKQMAESTEVHAGALLQQAMSEHAQQRGLFLTTSAIGLLLLAAWILLLARSVSGRLSRLLDAATRIAEGKGDRPIAVTGHDELAELGAAFNAMQEKVLARERALRASHEELESRVEARTHELNEANAHLLLQIDERRRAEEKLQHQAQYDSLTDLPNRMLALDRLSQAIRTAERTHTHAVLIYLDLDDFKKVNDTLGHQLGDTLLVQAAQRLRHAVRAEDTVARHGGDEFLVILGRLSAPDDSKLIAEKIVRAFAPSFRIGESDVVVSPSLGIAVYPDDGDNPSTLLRNADLAMYEAKEAGRNTYRYFNQQVHDSSLRRLAIEHRLRNALQRDEFELRYQPLVATGTREIIGAEALLRWNSPDYGLVTPDHFIAVAEHTGLIVEIGDWVLRSACVQLRAWRALGWPAFRIAVNVSPRQFRGDRLLASVRDCLAANALPAASLQIEVTEGLLIRNHPEVTATLQALSELGVRLAMDDFGTGYSSLSYLKRFPFHTLKIDREFVRDVASDPDDRALVTATIRMGKGLGLTVVAEGVETEEQFAFLSEHDCDIVQGFLFSKPLPPDEFAARWLGHAHKEHAYAASYAGK